MTGLSSLLLLTTLAAPPAPPPSQEDATYKQLEGKQREQYVKDCTARKAPTPAATPPATH